MLLSFVDNCSQIPAGTTSSASLQCQPRLPSRVESRLSLVSAIQDLRSAHSSEPGPSPLCLENQQRSEPGPSTSSTHRSAQAMLLSSQHVQLLSNDIEQSTSQAVASSSSHASSDDSPHYVPSPPSSLSDVDSEVKRNEVYNNITLLLAITFLNACTLVLYYWSRLA